MIIDVNFQEIDCKINANLCEPAKVIKPRFTENEEAIYKAGYSEGQSSMVDPEKVIEKTAQGTTTLTIDDVSEIPHDVDVQLGSYNLLDMDDIDWLDTSASGYMNTTANFTIKANTNYIVSWDVETDVFPYSSYVGIGKTYYAYSVGFKSNVRENGRVSIAFSVTQDVINQRGDQLFFRLCRYDVPTEANILISNIQLIEGTTDLPFMPYNNADFSGIALSINGETYSSTATGLFQGIKSVSPNMTFTTDEGIKIEARYHKSWGMQTEYDRFWDSYQENGNRKNYGGAFYGTGWTIKTMKPKYDIKPEAMANCFRGLYLNTNSGLLYLDMVKWLEDLGIVLDTSNCTTMTSGFQGCSFSRIGVLDARKSNNITYLFSEGYAYLRTIDKLILKDDGSQAFTGTFDYCSGLENVTIEGVIGQTVNLQHSNRLSKASITSLVNALSTTASGKIITFSKTAVNSAFGSTTSDEWLNLIATKSNWTISLV